MRKDLSSQIKLDRIPRRYYNPDSEIELTALRREEKINTFVFENRAGRNRQRARCDSRGVAHAHKCQQPYV